MKLLAQYFERYKRMTPPDVVIRDSVVRLIGEKIPYTLTREQITVRSGVVHIDCPALVKSEVSLRKTELLEELRTLSSPHTVRDIR